MDGFILDKGLFKDNNKYSLTLSESIRVVENWMLTIEEYKQASNPFEKSWDEYIYAVFQILGFNTEKIGHRLLLLKEFGGESFPCALCGIVLPNENTNILVPGLTWAEFLFFSAHYYEVDWGILFNGSQFEFFNLKRADFQHITTVANLEQILKRQQTDSFLELYKIFRIIKKYSSNDKQNNTVTLREFGNWLPDMIKQDLAITNREFEVLGCMATGMKNKDIAAQLKLSEGVIRNYTSSIYKKFEVANRVEAVNKARQIGLID